MSSSIAIPKRRQKRPSHPHSPSTDPSPSASSAAGPSHSSGSSSAAATPSSSYGGRTPGTSPRGDSISGPSGPGHYRRPSLLSESMGRGEYTVVDVGTGENMRLISCVRASQGFEWNQEMFLPSYADGYGSSADLEHRPDPIEDIVLTDEEIANMLPS